MSEHLDALKLRLFHERKRLEVAGIGTREHTIRAMWVEQIEKEIAGEYKFLGIEPEPANTMTDDEILAELES